MLQDSRETTALLTDWRNGDAAAAEQLITRVYAELRRLAAHYLRSEPPGHTLQATALVHELYVHMIGSQPVDWQNRSHFFAVAAQQLRRILIDHARAHRTKKRGGGAIQLSLDRVNGWSEPRSEEVLALDEALGRLAQLDARAAQAVELRFFGGLTEHEAATVLGISVATLKRDWEFARVWLLSQLLSSSE